MQIERAGGPEVLSPPVALGVNERVVIEHGGRVLSRCPYSPYSGPCTQLFTHVLGSGWGASSDPSTYASNSAAFRSEFGWSHDGDSAATFLSTGPTTAEVRIEGPPGAGGGRLVGQLPLSAQQVPYQAYWDPLQRQVLVGINALGSNFLISSELRKLPFTGGTAVPFISFPNKELYTAAISEDGTQLLVQTRDEVTFVCSIEYRDYATGQQVLQTVTLPGTACQNGTKATFLRRSALTRGPAPPVPLQRPPAGRH